MSRKVLVQNRPMVKAKRLLIASAGAITLAIAPMVVLASPTPRPLAAPVAR
jgi:hypothetical protein